MTLYEGQGHLNWFQTVDFSQVYRLTKLQFQRNWFSGVQADTQTQA